MGNGWELPGFSLGLALVKTEQISLVADHSSDNLLELGQSLLASLEWMVDQVLSLLLS